MYMYRFSWLMTFEIFRNFFFFDGVVGGWGVSYPIFFWIFIKKINIYKAPKVGTGLRAKERFVIILLYIIMVEEYIMEYE